MSFPTSPYLLPPNPHDNPDPTPSTSSSLSPSSLPLPLYKICLLGSSSSGKTSLLSVLCDQKFPKEYLQTKGINCKRIGGRLHYNDNIDQNHQSNTTSNLHINSTIANTNPNISSSSTSPTSSSSSAASSSPLPYPSSASASSLSPTPSPSSISSSNVTGTATYISSSSLSYSSSSSSSPSFSPTFHLDILDISSSCPFRRFCQNYIPHSSIIVLLYDKTNYSSFQWAEEAMSDIKNIFNNSSSHLSLPPIILYSTKGENDSSIVVSRNVHKNFMKLHHITEEVCGSSKERTIGKNLMKFIAKILINLDKMKRPMDEKGEERKEWDVEWEWREEKEEKRETEGEMGGQRDEKYHGDKTRKGAAEKNKNNQSAPGYPSPCIIQ